MTSDAENKAREVFKRRFPDESFDKLDERSRRHWVELGELYVHFSKVQEEGKAKKDKGKRR